MQDSCEILSPWCHRCNLHLHPPPTLPPSPLSFFLSFPQIVCLQNTHFIYVKDPSLPSSVQVGWLLTACLKGSSPKIVFDIMEKSGCCLLNFPRIPRNSCFSHLLHHITLPIPFILPPFMAKPLPNLFVSSLVAGWWRKSDLSMWVCVCASRLMCGCGDWFKWNHWPTVLSNHTGHIPSWRGLLPLDWPVKSSPQGAAY